MDGSELKMNGFAKTPSLTIPYDSDSNLPLTETVNPSPTKCPEQPVNQTGAPTVNLRRARKETKTPLKHPSHTSLMESNNQNLTEPEKELLRWHYKLGHIAIQRVQWLMRQGLLSSSERTRRLHAEASKLSHGVMCVACQYAKQRHRPTPGSVKKVIKEPLTYA